MYGYILTRIVSDSWVQYSMTHAFGPVHTMPEKLLNGCFILKTHQMFFVHTVPEEFENTTVTGHFRFVFEEISTREVT